MNFAESQLLIMSNFIQLVLFMEAYLDFMGSLLLTLGMILQSMIQLVKKTNKPLLQISQKMLKVWLRLMKIKDTDTKMEIMLHSEKLKVWKKSMKKYTRLKSFHLSVLKLVIQVVFHNMWEMVLLNKWKCQQKLTSKA